MDTMLPAEAAFKCTYPVFVMRIAYNSTEVQLIHAVVLEVLVSMRFTVIIAVASHRFSLYRCDGARREQKRWEWLLA